MRFWKHLLGALPSSDLFAVDKVHNLSLKITYPLVPPAKYSHDLHDVLVLEKMFLPDLLRRVLDTASPNQRVLELLQESFVDRVAKVFHRARLSSEHDRGRVVRKLTLGFGVDSDEVEVFPHLFKQVVKVPAVVSRDGHSVRNPVDNVELLNRNLIDFVEHVEG